MKKIIIILMAAAIIAPAVAFAADTFGSGMLEGSAGNLGLEENLNTGVAAVVSTILAVTGTIFLVLTVVGGIMWMTASGNDEKVGKAKKIIIGAAIGLAICLFAYTITAFVATRLSAASGGGTSTVNSDSACTGTCRDTSDCSAGLGGSVGHTSCPDDQICCAG